MCWRQVLATSASALKQVLALEALTHGKMSERCFEGRVRDFDPSAIEIAYIVDPGRSFDRSGPKTLGFTVSGDSAHICTEQHLGVGWCGRLSVG